MAIRFSGGPNGASFEMGQVDVASGASTATLHTSLGRVYGAAFCQLAGTHIDQFLTVIGAAAGTSGAGPTVADAQTGTSIGLNLTGTALNLVASGTTAGTTTYSYLLWGVAS